MELTPHDTALLDAYVAPFLALAGDRRTRRLLVGVIVGIIGSERLICRRIAAFSPSACLRPVWGETDSADVAG